MSPFLQPLFEFGLAGVEKGVDLVLVVAALPDRRFRERHVVDVDRRDPTGTRVTPIFFSPSSSFINTSAVAAASSLAR